MHLFCFASRNQENIRRGIEARKWAVATVSHSAMQSRATKAKKYMHPGDMGLLYCNPTHSFTVPFIVRSVADPITVVKDIWPEAWVLPFDIEPLGDLSKQVHMDLALQKWPVVTRQQKGAGGISAAMHITGTTVFVPVEITEEDWEIITGDLGF